MNDSRVDMYLDFAQFNGMRKLSRENEDEALRSVAKQMEGMFMNMMLKSMRDANAVFEEDSLFQSRESQFYRDMHDKQLANNLSNEQSLGLADVIYRQLSKNPDNGKTVANPFRSAPAAVPFATLPRTQTDRATSTMQADPSDLKPRADVLSNDRNDPQDLTNWRTPEEFISAIRPHAESAANQLNVPADAIMAQVALETGWGKHVMQNKNGNSSFNLFGIKADMRWQGEVTRKDTLEYRNGIAAKELAAFRSYESLADAFSDYVDFLKNNSRYQDVVNKKTEAKQWGYELQQAGYATDPKYGNKIAEILDSEVLKTALNDIAAFKR